MVSITEINIHGYASPEGSYANNTRLAEGRAASLKEYVKVSTLSPTRCSHQCNPEDWAGLRRLVEESTLPEKNEILAIIDNPNLEPDPRTTKSRNVSRRLTSICSRSGIPVCVTLTIR